MSALKKYHDAQLSFHHTRDEKPDPGAFFTHFHEMYELLYVVKGEGSFLVEGTSYPVFPGAVFLTRPGESHMMQVSDRLPYERMAIHFSLEMFSALDREQLLATELERRPLGKGNTFREEATSPLLAAFQNLPDASSPEFRLTLLSRLLFLLCDLRASFSAEGEGEDVEGGIDAVGRAIDYINANLFSDITLSSVAAHVFLSPSHLTRLFRERVGTPVYEYITRKRLLAAKARIESGVRATEAAEACGFCNYSSFFKAYKKRFGISPSASRGGNAKKEPLSKKI